MSDTRTSASWETIRFGLRMLAAAWGAHIALSIVSRLLWTALIAAMKASTGGYSALSWVLSGVSFVLQMAHLAVGVTLVVAASRLTRFPLVLREPAPGDPYRGSRDGVPALDPGIDGLAVGLTAALATSAALALLSYAFTTLLSFVSRIELGFGFRDVISFAAFVASLAGPAIFVIWSSRAARAVGRSLPLALAITALVGLVALCGFDLWFMIDRQATRAHPWSIWAMLGVNVLSSGVLIALALGLVEALRDQPRQPSA